MTDQPQPYGWNHQQERARHAASVAQGTAFCAELICLKPDRWIRPGSDWDLAHDRRTGGYLGPAHASCNRAEGARERHRRAQTNTAKPARWAL